MGYTKTSLKTRLKNRLIQLLGGSCRDAFSSYYEHERSIFQYTLLPRPWLEPATNVVPLQPDQLKVLEYDLRRYAHALDKGLQLPERRVGFGRDKAKRVIAMMDFLCASKAQNCTLYKWTLSILKQYAAAMTVDTGNSDLTQDQTNYLTDWNKELSDALERLPDLGTETTDIISEADVLPTAFERRSIRRWTDKAVEDDILRTLVKAALWAPASCNRQPHHFLFVRDSKKINLVVGLASGAKGFAEKAPCMLVLLSDVRAYYAPNERHLAYIDASLAGENLTLTAHEMGLGCVWLNWAIEDLSKEDTLREALKIPPYYAVIALIAIGYPDKSLTCLPPDRRNVEDCIAFDEMKL